MMNVASSAISVVRPGSAPWDLVVRERGEGDDAERRGRQQHGGAAQGREHADQRGDGEGAHAGRGGRLFSFMRRSRSTPISRPAPSATRMAAASGGKAHSFGFSGIAAHYRPKFCLRMPLPGVGSAALLQ